MHSAEESLAYASGYERSAGIKTYASGYACEAQDENSRQMPDSIDAVKRITMSTDPELEGLWQIESEVSDGDEHFPEPILVR